MHRNGDHSLMVTAGLGRDYLNNALRDVNLRPVETATIPKSKAGVYADEDEFIPFVIGGLGIGDWGLGSGLQEVPRRGRDAAEW